VIILSAVDEAVLTTWARSAQAAHRDVIRARIVLGAADGHANAVIAADLGLHLHGARVATAVLRAPTRWAGRPAPVGALAPLHPGPGRRDQGPGLHPATEHGVPLARWSVAELVTEAVDQGLVAAISPATVRRWLTADAIKPWQHRSWIFPRDPDFAAKAGAVLDLSDRH